MYLAERILTKRRSHGLSQTKLALLLGMSGSYLCRIEKGQEGVGLEYVPRLAEFLDISVDELVQIVIEERHPEMVRR